MKTTTTRTTTRHDQQNEPGRAAPRPRHCERIRDCASNDHAIGGPTGAPSFRRRLTWSDCRGRFTMRTVRSLEKRIGDTHKIPSPTRGLALSESGSMQESAPIDTSPGCKKAGEPLTPTASYPLSLALALKAAAVSRVVCIPIAPRAAGTWAALSITWLAECVGSVGGLIRFYGGSPDCGCPCVPAPSGGLEVPPVVPGAI